VLPRILRGAHLRFPVGLIVVFVTKALRFAEPDAVDDGGVILKIAKAQISPVVLNGSLRKLPYCGSFQSARLRRGFGGQAIGNPKSLKCLVNTRCNARRYQRPSTLITPLSSMNSSSPR